MKQPAFPELATTSLAELFRIVDGALPQWDKALHEIASRWHDPNCECKFKEATEVEACLRCSNVRRIILERL